MCRDGERCGISVQFKIHLYFFENCKLDYNLINFYFLIYLALANLNFNNFSRIN